VDLPPTTEHAQHEKFERLVAEAGTLPPAATAVVHPCDEASLGGAVEAAAAGLIVPILVGPRHKIEAVAAAAGIDISAFRLESKGRRTRPPR